MTGVLVVIITATGHVAAAEADFEPGNPAGFSVEEMQTQRARDRAWKVVMRAYCHDDIAKAINDGYALRQVCQRLLDAGWKEEAKAVEVQGVGR